MPVRLLRPQTSLTTAQGQTISVTSPQPGQFLVQTQPPSWQQVIDVSGGDRDLEMVHGQQFALPSALLLLVCAEHTRGASQHNHAAWLISHQGQVLGHWPGRFADTVAHSAVRLWLLEHTGSEYEPLPRTPLRVHAICPTTGGKKAPTRRIKLPPFLAQQLTAPWQLQAHFSLLRGNLAVVHRQHQPAEPLYPIEIELAVIEALTPP